MLTCCCDCIRERRRIPSCVVRAACHLRGTGPPSAIPQRAERMHQCPRPSPVPTQRKGRKGGKRRARHGPAAPTLTGKGGVDHERLHALRPVHVLQEARVAAQEARHGQDAQRHRHVEAHHDARVARVRLGGREARAQQGGRRSGAPVGTCNDEGAPAARRAAPLAPCFCFGRKGRWPVSLTQDARRTPAAPSHVRLRSTLTRGLTRSTPTLITWLNAPCDAYVVPACASLSSTTQGASASWRRRSAAAVRVSTRDAQAWAGA